MSVQASTRENEPQREQSSLHRSEAQRLEAQRFIDQTPLRTIFGIPEEALDAVMATAYQLYQSSRYDEVAVLCRGLIAADHTYGWSYSLYAATLRRLGRLDEALAQLEIGLRYEPNEPKLLFMRGELREALGRAECVAA